MQNWLLTQSSFDQFLGLLDRDREAAGRKYEELRIRMVKFFEWRACPRADALADVTLDRIMRKVEAGVEVEDPVKYAYGVSRLVYLESLKSNVREEELDIDLPAFRPDVDDEEERRLDCLEKCLGELPPNSRSMILGYYRDERQAKIDHRKALAERFNVSLNALRIKTLRIRTALEACVMKCLGSN